MPSAHPLVTIPETQVRLLSSSQTKQAYSISVALPPGYADSDRSYPTLYMLDANWLFDMTANIVRLLGFDGQVPPLVIVGIGYPGKWFDTPMRNHDYVPPGWVDDPRSGGADQFLRFIREDLFPFVGAEYRVDPSERIFWGDSLGGLFGLHVLFSQPDTFSRYVLGSPWIAGDNHPVYTCEHEYADGHTDLPARVFMGAGGLEFDYILNNLNRLGQVLRDRNYASLKLTTQVFEGESHISVMPFNLSKGVRAVFG